MGAAPATGSSVRGWNGVATPHGGPLALRARRDRPVPAPGHGAPHRLEAGGSGEARQGGGELAPGARAHEARGLDATLVLEVVPQRQTPVLVSERRLEPAEGREVP